MSATNWQAYADKHTAEKRHATAADAHGWTCLEIGCDLKGGTIGTPPRAPAADPVDRMMESFADDNYFDNFVDGQGY